MSEKSLTQRFDDSMSSLSSEKRINVHAYFMFYHLARYIKLCFFLFSFHLTMMTWSHRNVVLNFLRSFLSLDIIIIST